MKCKDCYYWRRLYTTSPSGDCHRYPRVTVVQEDHWCGEYEQDLYDTKEPKDGKKKS